MLLSLRNLIVNILALFISDKEARHKFRNKYKRKSKYRKLRDDNRQLFNDILGLKREFFDLKANYNKHFNEYERIYSNKFHVEPLDDKPPLGPESEVFLAIVCVAKNEGPYLKEWIEYHKIVGVERFYFYDNESDDDTKEILAPYIKDGTVVYHFLPNHPITNQRPQIEAYNDAIFKYRDRVSWMAVIDVDEFIVPIEKNTIQEFLDDYVQYPGVVVNWVCFDSNGHETIPTEHGGLLTANYTRARKDHNCIDIGQNKAHDRLVKSIVNPKLVVNYISAHYAIYYLNLEAVTEAFQKTRGMTTKSHSSNKIRINHYITKSRQEYVNKINRNVQGSNAVYQFNEDTLNFKGETVEDLVIQKYIPQLKSALGIK